MLFAQRQNSPHELGQNPVANGIGEYPHWVHESLVFTKPCFFCISKTSRPFLPRRNHLPNGHGCQSEHFPLRRSSRSHPPMRHASLAASSIAGHLWLPGVMFHAHQGASGLGNTWKLLTMLANYQTQFNWEKTGGLGCLNNQSKSQVLIKKQGLAPNSKPPTQTTSFI